MNRRIQIIAEMGINHGGNMDLARKMILEAKACGADVLKTQLYDPRKDFGDPPRKPDLFSKSDWQAIYASRLTQERIRFLKDACDVAGIEFMSSVTDLERLEWLEEIGVKRYKIASDVATNKEVCNAIFSKGKPVIVSCGHVHHSGEQTRYLRRVNIKTYWLYCVSKYPTLLEELKFTEIFSCDYPEEDRQVSVFNQYEYDGFSDHTIGISAAVTAMSLGARIIEKHFTLGKNLPGPDHVCSADLNELRQLCKMRDDIEKILYKD